MIVYFVARLSSHEILLVLLNILEILKHLSFILICGYMKILSYYSLKMEGQITFRTKER